MSAWFEIIIKAVYFKTVPTTHFTFSTNVISKKLLDVHKTVMFSKFSNNSKTNVIEIRFALYCLSSKSSTYLEVKTSCFDLNK